MSENIFNNPLGENFKLARYPANEKLKAWDSADELLIQEFKENKKLIDKKILIINDSFGALSLALKDWKSTTYTDSYVSFKAMKDNQPELNIINDLSLLKGKYDLVLIKLPKSLSFFEDILANLSQFLPTGTPIIFGCMVKYLAKGYFEIIEKYIGEVRTSLAQKKARLIYSEFIHEKKKSPYPQNIYIDAIDAKFLNHSSVFSRNKLDIGTRFFLNHIPAGEYNAILDLGCGNGIIGIQAKKKNPKAKLLLSDDSFMAIKSSQENIQNFNFDSDSTFFWTNCFEKAVAVPVDLVLCNPPFHQNNTMGDFIALQMFSDSKDALVSGGQIRVIGNSHLGYHQKLKKIFGNSKIIATNKKFMIVDAFKK